MFCEGTGFLDVKVHICLRYFLAFSIFSASFPKNFIHPIGSQSHCMAPVIG